MDDTFAQEMQESIRAAIAKANGHPPSPKSHETPISELRDKHVRATPRRVPEDRLSVVAEAGTEPPTEEELQGMQPELQELVSEGSKDRSSLKLAAEEARLEAGMEQCEELKVSGKYRNVYMRFYRAGLKRAQHLAEGKEVGKPGNWVTQDMAKRWSHDRAGLFQDFVDAGAHWAKLEVREKRRHTQKQMSENAFAWMGVALAAVLSWLWFVLVVDGERVGCGVVGAAKGGLTCAVLVVHSVENES